jgi:hypothetical protein
MTAAAFSVLLGVCSSVVAAEPDNLLGIITNSAGVEAGLCVHIGSTDGAIEIQMAGNRVGLRYNGFWQGRSTSSSNTGSKTMVISAARHQKFFLFIKLRKFG